MQIDISQDDFGFCEKHAKELNGDIRYLVAISAIASHNTPERITNIIQLYLDTFSDESKCIDFIQRTRESILKMTSIMGTPKGINALSAVSNAIRDDSTLKNALSKIPPIRNESGYNYASMKARGSSLFNAIYDRHSDKVLGKLNSLYPDLAEVIIVDSYGRLLGETRYLSAVETELCAIGALVPLDVPMQLKSHCIGASRLGATEEMVQAALRLAKAVCIKKI